MTDPNTTTPPQDGELAADPQLDAAATSAAEDLDEDRLGTDPLEDGMEPPEGWSEADAYGTTRTEQRDGESLDDRLEQERPDVS
ncbi:hypothetical protein [Fodinicola acaciae]|uniref:hypothetical protein n=1 Tax=Fodinicola acaciae TaxID=2681555 RepID=UPI0013D22BA2|nr:hypothetical protein [Fodinicola acaciae]